MPDFVYRYPASAIANRQPLTADDIFLLRKHMFPRGLVSNDDARQLRALHRTHIEKCVEWNNWFVEMMTAFIVVHTDPHYLLDQDNAEWLIGMVSVNGMVATSAELELTLHAIEMSGAVPDILSAFALDQLRIALTLETGAYARQRGVKRMGIAAQDLEFVYRILRGSLVGGKMLLSARELVVIDMIDAVVRDNTNHPAWHALVRSVARRTPEGYACPSPWLQMMVDDVALGHAA